MNKMDYPGYHDVQSEASMRFEAESLPLMKGGKLVLDMYFQRSVNE